MSAPPTQEQTQSRRISVGETVTPGGAVSATVLSLTTTYGSQNKPHQLYELRITLKKDYDNVSDKMYMSCTHTLVADLKKIIISSESYCPLILSLPVAVQEVTCTRSTGVEIS